MVFNKFYKERENKDNFAFLVNIVKQDRPNDLDWQSNFLSNKELKLGSKESKRFMSPQPKVFYFGIPNDYFLNIRKRILKKNIKMRKVNFVLHQKKTHCPPIKIVNQENDSISGSKRVYSKGLNIDCISNPNQKSRYKAKNI